MSVKYKKNTRYDEYIRSEVCESFGEWLGIELPRYEYREVDFSRCKYEYRMFRLGNFQWDNVYGEWQPTKKAAKASYKEALRRTKEVCHA